MLYQLKIKLRGITFPPVWRRAVVPGGFTFDELHKVIHAAFGWGDYHWYHFADRPYGRKYYIALPTENDDDYGYQTTDSRQITVEEFYQSGRTKLCYVYDFGDDWKHDVVLEQIIDAEQETATCIAGKGACPEEDCGGSWGYEDMKENGEVEDPKSFDLEEANEEVVAAVCHPFPRKEKKGKGGNSKSKLEIHLNDWLCHMPYTATSEIDVYYTSLVNKVLGILDDKAFFDPLGIDDDDIQIIAVALTLWFQDVVSGGGIWQAFTRECLRRYGRHLPFYDYEEDEYFEGEVNEVDVRFLLWHYMQTLQTKSAVINPVTKNIAIMAADLYALFDEEFELAPINDDWYDTLQPSSLGGKPKEALLYAFNTYLKTTAAYNYLDLTFKEEAISAKEEIEEMYEGEELKRHLYDLEALLLYENKRMLGLTAQQWGERIVGGSLPAAERDYISNMKTITRRFYEIIGEDKNAYSFQDIADKEMGVQTIYKVSKKSFEVAYSEYKDIYFFARLTQVGGQWMLNGSLMAVPISIYEMSGMCKTLRCLSEPFKQQLHERFMQLNDGKPFAFFKTRKSFVAFYKQLYGTNYNKQLLPDDVTKYITFSVTPENGDIILDATAQYLKCDYNPYYDEMLARKVGALSMFVNPELCSYEAACQFYDLGMLADAKLTDFRGEDIGRQLLNDNAQFVLDYFHHGCRSRI